MQESSAWRRILIAVAASQFIALGGGNLVFPFLPFYIEDLGVSGSGKIGTCLTRRLQGWP